MAYSREASSDSSEGLAAEGPCFLAQIVLRPKTNSFKLSIERHLSLMMRRFLNKEIDVTYRQKLV